VGAILVHLVLDPMRGLFEPGQRGLVQLLGGTRFDLASLEHVVDRLQKEDLHDEILRDEDRHDSEQRQIGHQVDLHTLLFRSRKIRGGEAVAFYHRETTSVIRRVSLSTCPTGASWIAPTPYFGR